MALHVTRRRHGERRREVYCLRVASGRGTAADLAIGHIIEVGRRGPRGLERERVLAAGKRLAIGLEAARSRSGRVVNDRAAGSPRGRVHATRAARHTMLIRTGGCCRVDRECAAARPHERDLGVARAPRGHVVIARVGRHLRHLAGREFEHPHVVVAGVTAVRRERDARAVVRPSRLAVVVRAGRELVQSRAVRCDGPDVPAAIAIALKGDPLSVGRPGWLARVVVLVGDALRRTTTRGQRPDAALQVDRKRSSVWRRGDRH